MIRSIPRHFRLAGLMLAVLVAAGHSLKADEYTVGVNTSGAATATISFTGNGGIDVYTVPFSATDTTTGSAAFAAFCVDLYHDQPLGTSTGETGPAYSIASLAGSSILSQAFPNTGYSDLASRMNYMGSVYSARQLRASPAQDPDVAGAFQLALWSLLDSNFKVVSFNGDAVLSTDTSLLTTLLGAANSNGSGGGTHVQFEESNGSMVGVNVAAYSLTANYSSSNGQLILLHPTPGSAGPDQNLLTWGQSSINIQSAPEPSSFAIAGLGALAFAGYALRRRRARA